MINESDLVDQLRDGGGSQISAEEFAAQVKGMAEDKAMETAELPTLTIFHDIAMSHGFTPENARELFNEAGRSFELNDEWTPEDAIQVSDWLKEAQAKKRRSTPELPYEPDTERAARISSPAYDDARIIHAEMIPPAPPDNTQPGMDLSINFDTKEQVEEFLETLKSSGVSLGKPGSARVVLRVSDYTAQAAVWQDL